MQAEAERVIGIIQRLHQKVCEAATSLERNMSEHVSSDLVEHMQKVKEEEVRADTEKLVKIVGDFLNKINASQFIEH